MKQLLITALILVSSQAFAANGNLEDDLKSLDVQEAVPNQVSKEKLYSIQSRATSLKGRIEILAGAAQNYTGNGFLQTQQVGGELQYHLNDEWSVGLGYSQVFNTFKSDADRLLQEQGVLPDVDYAKTRMEAKIQYNLFYGKFRFSQESVMYFDQYWAGGYAQNKLGSGDSNGPMGDVGFAFWVKSWGSIHLGLKDYYYTEKAALSKGAHHNIHGYMQVGYLL
jgi:outer membrane beta-barrel protein